ncbi:hypothetical protein HK097_005951, partial [Rhizophlyctis rosea]
GGEGGGDGKAVKADEHIDLVKPSPSPSAELKAMFVDALGRSPSGPLKEGDFENMGRESRDTLRGDGKGDEEVELLDRR